MYIHVNYIYRYPLSQQDGLAIEPYTLVFNDSDIARR